VFATKCITSNAASRCGILQAFEEVLEGGFEAMGKKGRYVPAMTKDWFPHF